jgi:hypothetical protein
MAHWGCCAKRNKVCLIKRRGNITFGYNDWTFEISEFDSRGEQEMYFFYTGPETQKVSYAANHSPPSKPYVKSKWRYTSIPPHLYMNYT